MKLIRIHCHTETGEQLSACSLEIHPDLLAAYEKMGLIEIKQESIDYEDLRRLKRILRLKQNCGVNTVGASIIVDLLERIEELQDEIELLRRK
jgi:MerR family transcriptional regulator/heat shock protein HspR